MSYPCNVMVCVSEARLHFIMIRLSNDSSLALFICRSVQWMKKSPNKSLSLFSLNGRQLLNCLVRQSKKDTLNGFASDGDDYGINDE